MLTTTIDHIEESISAYRKGKIDMATLECCLNVHAEELQEIFRRLRD